MKTTRICFSFRKLREVEGTLSNNFWSILPEVQILDNIQRFNKYFISLFIFRKSLLLTRKTTWAAMLHISKKQTELGVECHTIDDILLHQSSSFLNSQS